MNAEIAAIVSDSKTSEQCKTGEQRQAYISNRISSLETNINKRGIKQGNFRVHFSSKGEPEPVSLNKDHAISIISPTPEKVSDEYQHVLTNVVDPNPFMKTLPMNVATMLQLPERFTKLELAKLIWHHFYKMVDILSKDPEPVLKPNKIVGSKKPDDYIWGYSNDDCKHYKHHAECFYQLFCLKHGSKELSPYMVKLIDHVPELMRKLPFPLARFQAEGGEHVNYLQNCFYHQHTRRHGGKGKPDPVYELFFKIWKDLRYEIDEMLSSEDPEAQQAATDFQLYVKQHGAAATIQRAFRSHLAKKQPNLASTHNRESNPTTGPQIFSGFNFVLCGRVSTSNGKALSQEAMKMLIKENGGRVKNKLPDGKGKGISTKRYTLLCAKSVIESGKVPDCIRTAVRKGYNILSYDFVHDAILKKTCDTDRFQLNIKALASRVTPDISLENKHFSKTPRLLTMIKGPRRKRWNAETKKNTNFNKYSFAGKNASQLYVITRRKEIVDERARSKSDRLGKQALRNINSSLFKEWNGLPRPEKDVWKKRWRNQILKNQQRLMSEKDEIARLADYNRVQDPAYSSHLVQ
jgi:hypothetical protein